MKHLKLEQYVNNGEWKLARQELEQISEPDFDDTVAILAASICFYEGAMEEMYSYIARGIAYNPSNYELYLLLGNYYEKTNINQAWLCYENAEFYCANKEDLEIIRQYKARVEALEEWDVHRTSIVILSYNLKDICRECIESIRENNSASSYEIVVVDNASSDGIVEWLKEQDDIKLICNAENMGFPYGCNQGIKAAEPDNDILLLNNDTIVLPNSIFWLRMGLYENAQIGATGSVSNFVGNNQKVEKCFSGKEEYLEYGRTINVPMKHAYEKKVWLVGFAMLLKRKAIDSVGLLDNRFSPGSFEDNDISVRLQYAGYKLLLCRNSFIFHYGSGGGNNRGVWNPAEERNHEKFKQKWGFDIRYYTWSREELISLIEKGKGEKFRVLEVGCGCGATLAKIDYLWENADVCGIELVDSVARIGANYLDIIQGNIETMELPYEQEAFDYIIFGDVLEHLYHPEAVLRRLMPYLKQNGRFLCSIPNVMHESVILPLLKGKFEYREAGILDRTHIRFFTLDSIVRMLDDCGLKICRLSMTREEFKKTKEDEELLDALYRVPHVAEQRLFDVYQYVFAAGRRE